MEFPIRYRVIGSGEPALIFIHGWSSDSTYWDAQLDFFSKHYTVVTLDLAGHGDSGTARAEWTMPAFGADVVSVAQQIPNQRLMLVGHSMGGPVALEAARRLKGRIIGIVGVDTFGNIGLPRPTPKELEARVAPMRRDFATTHARLRHAPVLYAALRSRSWYAASPTTWLRSRPALRSAPSSDSTT